MYQHSFPNVAEGNDESDVTFHRTVAAAKVGVSRKPCGRTQGPQQTTILFSKPRRLKMTRTTAKRRQTTCPT